MIHFLYNGMAVTQIFIITRQGKSIEKAMDESMPIWMGIIAIIASFVLLNQFKKASEKQFLIHPSILNENREN